MKAYRTFFVVITSILVNACASTGNSYFKQAAPEEPHAVLEFEMGEKIGFLFDVRVAKVIPKSINGIPVNSWEQDWKLHAYGKFLIPPGDTIVSLSYNDRDISAYENVRFDAQQGEVYKVTFSKEEKTTNFSVTDSSHRIVTSVQSKRKKYFYDVPRVELASDLFEAAADGDIKKVRLLLNEGAEPNWNGPRNFTSLIIAASRGYIEIVQVLIEAGANVNAGADWTALTFAADRGHEAIVRLLLDSGANIDFRMPGEYSALMAAAERGHVGIVKLLLRKGAYTNTRLRNGKTALELAKEAGNQEIVDMLVKSRANAR
jgi:ankyrin repeat protein